MPVRGHHVHRIEAVLDHVDEHLGDDLSLERLAQLAAISPFHFHRLFLAWTGETVKCFVRRRRLESAAGRLRHCPEEKITVLALNCGFSSPEAFARAFREHFGMTPSQWRTGGWTAWRTPANDPCHGRAFRVEVKRSAPVDYLFMRARGDYAAQTAGLWDRFLPIVHSLGLSSQPLAFFGLDDPDIAGPSNCRMDACVQLPPGWSDPGVRLLRHRFDARWIASLSYDGPAHGIGQGWHSLLTDWLPGSTFAMGEGHFFERYDPNEGTPGCPLVRCELCMPVQLRVTCPSAGGLLHESLASRGTAAVRAPSFSASSFPQRR
jgi:AraC family transcriptional regulator